MKALKLFDIIMQLLLFISGFYFFFTNANDYQFIYSYFALGGWQIMSAIIHAFSSQSWVSNHTRRIYGFATLIIGILSLLIFLTNFRFEEIFMLYLFGLLIFTPMIAIWYLLISLKEFRKIEKKEFIHLK